MQLLIQRLITPSFCKIRNSWFSGFSLEALLCNYQFTFSEISPQWRYQSSLLWDADMLSELILYRVNLFLQIFQRWPSWHFKVDSFRTSFINTYVVAIGNWNSFALECHVVSCAFKFHPSFHMVQSCTAETMNIFVQKMFVPDYQII